MSRKLLAFVALAILGGLMTGMVSDAVAGHELIGAPKCKACHKAKTGDQWGIWEGSAHAGAFATLASDEAKKVAADKGLGDPQTEAACLKCHTTKAFLGADVVVDAKGKYEDAEGVGCEACHGPGSDYKSKKVMEDSAAAKEAGLIMNKSEEFCVKCHNEESPTFKGFVFAERWDAIKHPAPEK
jgi:hypothetical protein